MSVITVDGQIGAGAPELGKKVAGMFGFEYVDRLALPGSYSQGLVEQPEKLTDRLWSIIERAVSGFALGNAAGDPYFNVPQELLIPLTWDSDGPSAVHSTAEYMPNVEQVFEQGKAVIVHRAGCVEAGDREALKVGLFASWEDRIQRVMSREGLKNHAAAEDAIKRREQLQHEYFGDVHGVNPEDRSLYDIAIDTSAQAIHIASIKVARFARQSMVLQPA
ncbi:MAG: AAA family ATPase [Dehalococcoidia bacterium]